MSRRKFRGGRGARPHSQKRYTAIRTMDKIRNDARLLYAFLSDTPDASGALDLVLDMGGKSLISEPAP